MSKENKIKFLESWGYAIEDTDSVLGCDICRAKNQNEEKVIGKIDKDGKITIDYISKENLNESNLAKAVELAGLLKRNDLAYEEKISKKEAIEAIEHSGRNLVGLLKGSE